MQNLERVALKLTEESVQNASFTQRLQDERVYDCVKIMHSDM